MNRRSFLLWSAALGMASGRAALAQEFVTDSEREIYTLVMNRLFGGIRDRQMLVIVDPLTLSLGKGIPGISMFDNAEDFAEQVRREFTEAGRAVVDDLVRPDRPAARVRFGTVATAKGVEIRFATAARVREIFGESGDPWKRFDSAYPGAQGLMRFSRAGTDGKAGQAFVYSEMKCPGLCGFGYLTFLTRKGKGWNIARMHRVWVS